MKSTTYSQSPLGHAVCSLKRQEQGQLNVAVDPEKGGSVVEPVQMVSAASRSQPSIITFGRTTTGGQTYLMSKPGASNTIVCFEEKPNTGFSYSAEFIHKSITQKYRIKK